MGIDSLLPALRPVMTTGNLSSFSNKTVAIDAMGWLYRGAFFCVPELIAKKTTSIYLEFTYKMISTFKRCSITPIFCVDGRGLKAKDRTTQLRADRKQAELEKGMSFLKSGDMAQAKKALGRSVSVTKKMVYRLIDMLTSLNQEFIIAPYEADAQVAYLCRNGYAEFAISADSDLMCYHSPVTVFKVNSLGECEYIDVASIRERRARKESLGNDMMDSLFDLSEENFAYACIMAGCDYLPSIKGMGFKKAIGYFTRFGNVDSVIARLRIEKQFMGQVPEGYENAVKKVWNLFRYQLVYDPGTKSMVTLNKLGNERSGSMEDFVKENKEFVGDWIEDIENYAKGRIDMETLKEREFEVLNVRDMFGAAAQKKKMDDEEGFLELKKAMEGAGSKLSQQNFSQMTIKMMVKKPTSVDKENLAALQQSAALVKSESTVSTNSQVEVKEGGDGNSEVKDIKKKVNSHKEDSKENKEKELLSDICEEVSKGFIDNEEEKEQKTPVKKGPTSNSDDLEVEDKSPASNEPSSSARETASIFIDTLLTPDQEEMFHMDLKSTTTPSASQNGQKATLKRKFSKIETQSTEATSSLSTENNNKSPVQVDINDRNDERDLKKVKKNSPATLVQPKISLFFSKPKNNDA